MASTETVDSFVLFFKLVTAAAALLEETVEESVLGREQVVQQAMLCARIAALRRCGIAACRRFRSAANGLRSAAHRLRSAASRGGLAANGLRGAANGFGLAANGVGLAANDSVPLFDCSVGTQKGYVVPTTN